MGIVVGQFYAFSNSDFIFVFIISENHQLTIND